jgi:hypothetical protein
MAEWEDAIKRVRKIRESEREKERERKEGEKKDVGMDVDELYEEILKSVS